jgi:TonB family protein
MASATIDGGDRFDAESRKRFRRLVGVSLATHAVALLVLAFGPRFGSPPPGIPGVVTVDLVAAAPGAVPGPTAPVPKPAPPKPAPEPPPKVEAPKPKPEPVPVKPPPPKPDKVVLPKQAVKAPEKAPPKPKAAPEKPVDYDDLMKQLRESRGESRPEPVQTAKAAPAPAPADTAESGGDGGGGGTVKVSPEVMAWIRDARIHVRKNWVRAPGFQGLVTTLSVELDEGGNVVGEPTVKQRSGNPFYDDSVIRAIQKASPLPRPPTPGAWTFVFPSEEPAS